MVAYRGTVGWRNESPWIGHGEGNWLVYPGSGCDCEMSAAGEVLVGEEELEKGLDGC